MRKVLILIAMICMLANATLTGNVNSFTINGWTVKYSVVDSKLNIEAMGTNKGAVAVGFGGSKMAGVDAVSFLYDSNVKIADRNYISPPAPVGGKPQVLEDTARTPSGTADYTDNGSTYDSASGAWKLMFSRKLDTGDQYDIKIVDSQDIQVTLALFASHTWGDQHTSANYQTVKFMAALDSASPILSIGASIIASLLIALI